MKTLELLGLAKRNNLILAQFASNWKEEQGHTEDPVTSLKQLFAQQAQWVWTVIILLSVSIFAPLVMGASIQLMLAVDCVAVVVLILDTKDRYPAKLQKWRKSNAEEFMRALTVVENVVDHLYSKSTVNSVMIEKVEKMLKTQGAEVFLLQKVPWRKPEADRKRGQFIALHGQMKKLTRTICRGYDQYFPNCWE